MDEQAAQVRIQVGRPTLDGLARQILALIELEPARKHRGLVEAKIIQPALTDHLKSLVVSLEEVVRKSRRTDKAVRRLVDVGKISDLKRIRGIERVVRVDAVRIRPQVNEAGRRGERDAKRRAGVVVAG